jgi:hypothetical protein
MIVLSSVDADIELIARSDVGLVAFSDAGEARALVSGAGGGGSHRTSSALD